MNIGQRLRLVPKKPRVAAQNHSCLKKFWFDWKLNFQEPLLLYSPTAAPATPTTPTTPTPLC